MKRFLVLALVLVSLGGFLSSGSVVFAMSHNAQSHMIPLTCDGGTGTSCDNLFPVPYGCQGNGGSVIQVDLQDDQVYAGSHHVGVMHLYESRGVNGCYADWIGMRVDSGVCVWASTAGGTFVDDGSMGIYNVKEVTGDDNPGQVCGGWITTLMDESEFYVTGRYCTSAWQGDSTGFDGGRVYDHKLIHAWASGQSC